MGQVRRVNPNLARNEEGSTRKQPSGGLGCKMATRRPVGCCFVLSKEGPPTRRVDCYTNGQPTGLIHGLAQKNEKNLFIFLNYPFTLEI